LRRQEGVAIFLTFTLLDANQHTLGVDVYRPQMPDFRQPQTRGVGRHEEHTVLEITGGLEQTHQFCPAVHLRQLPGVLAAHASKIKRCLAKNLAIEEGDGCRPQVTGPLGKLAFDQEMKEIGTDLFESQLVG
jgi:hypothetical protein